MDISVITPFYKGNRYMQQLFACIRRGALAAPEAEIELILVNDSPDCPISFQETWIRGFSVRIVNNAVNSGIHCSRVRGLQAAAGEFVWFLDQDDLLEEDAFSSQLALAEQTDVILANGYDQNPNNPGPIYKSVARQKAATESRFYYRVGNQIVSPGHVLIRRSAIPRLWTEHIVEKNGSDDLLLWLLMFRENCRWAINPRQIYTHVDTGENVSANIEKMAASSLEVLALLEKAEAVTPKEKKQFLRGTRMLAAYAGKGGFGKAAAMLRYPDVAWERIRLKALESKDR